LTEINSAIQANLAYGDSVQFFRQAYLFDKDGKTRPLLNTGAEAGQYISYDHGYPLQIYHRIVSNDTDVDTAAGKGRYAYITRTYNMILVGMGNTKKLTDRAYEGTDDVANEVFAAMPMPLADAWIFPGTINPNKHEVIEQEFAGDAGAATYINKLSLELVAFTIEYQIQQKVRCGNVNATAELTSTTPLSGITANSDVQV
jgi:hypothetical protein